MAVNKAEIYLLRHGETVWNAEGRYQGCLNSPLTPKGQSQALLMGEILAAELGATTALPLHISPLGRVRETADLVQQKVQFSSVIVKDDLCETSFGAWEGMRVADVRAQRPELTEVFEKWQALLHAPDGEPVDHVQARLTRWLESLDGPVVAISHGVLGRVLRGLYLGLSIEEALVLPIPQDAIWHLREGTATLLRSKC